MTRKRRFMRFSCPSCRSKLTLVISSTAMESGVVVRRRVCETCQFKWYTGQEPEYLINNSKIRFINRRASVIEEEEE